MIFSPGMLERISGQTSEREAELVTKKKREVQKDLLVRWLLFVLGWINIHD